MEVRKTRTRTNHIGPSTSTITVVNPTQVKSQGQVKIAPKQPSPITGYTVSLKRDNEYGSVEILKDGECVTSATLSCNSVDCSCGIQDCDGLSQFASMYIELGIKCTTRKELVKEALLLAINSIKKEESAAFVIVSNNNAKGTEVINEICDEICICCTDYRLNPNMNNSTKIRAWFI